MKNTLIITIGLPRSGKSTWAKEQNYPIVNPDSIRYALHGHRFLPEAEPFVWAIARVMVKALFLAGHEMNPYVILDATNNTAKRRAAWISDDWDTRACVFHRDKESCIRQAREEDDHEIVPIIEKMAAEHEPLSETEGIMPDVYNIQDWRKSPI